MSDILARMNSGELIGLTAVVMGCLTAMCTIVGGFWYGIRKTEAEAALKRELLAAGMSADEIVRVVVTTSGGSVPKTAPAIRQSA